MRCWWESIVSMRAGPGRSTWLARLGCRLVLALLAATCAQQAAACTITFNANRTGSTNYSLSTPEMDACDPVQAGAFNDNVGDFGNTTMSPSGSLLQMDSFSDPSHIKFTYVGNGAATPGVPETGTFWAYDAGGSTIVPHTVRVNINGAAPAVTDISPSAGPRAGGTVVTINGSNFTGVTAVRFGSTNASSFIPVSATQISATSPAGTAGTVDVTVITPGGTSAIGPGDRFAYTQVTVTPASLSNAAVGSAYSQAMAAGGGVAPYSYAITAGSLPAGLSLSTVGGLSGTPTAGGNFNFTVTATDSSGMPGLNSGARNYTLAVDPPVLGISPVSGTSLSGTALSAYSQTFSGSGGTAPRSYGLTVDSGAMPSGLSFSSSTGVLSGTPTSAGTVGFSVTATDASTGSGPYAVTGSYSLTITAPALTIAPTSLANPAIGMAYSQAVTASGGTAPYAYAISAGALPAGLTLGAGTNVIGGTPTAAGSFSFTVKATDANSFAGTQLYSVTVAAPTISILPTALPDGQKNAAYSQTVTASGGTAPYTYAISAGTLPDGVALDPSTGVLSGTPTVTGTFSITVRATDQTGGVGAPFSGSHPYGLRIGSANADLLGLDLSGAPLLPAFGAGTTAYTASVANAVSTLTVTPTGADAGATVQVHGATVASGSPSGSIALSVGSNTVTVQVTAQDGSTTKTYTLTVTRAGLQTATGGGGMSLRIANVSAACTLTNAQFTDQAALPGPQRMSLPAGYTYPLAAVDFTADHCGPGSDLTVTLGFPGGVPAGAVLMKYDASANPPWQTFTPDSVGNNEVTYTISDDGPLDTSKMPGQFIDPVILAVPAPAGPHAIPTLNQWGLLLLSLLAGLAGAAALARGRAGRA